jgi:hypothetical protein
MPRCPAKTLRSCPYPPADHNFTVESALPLMTKRPSGENPQQFTAPAWPSNEHRSWYEEASYIRSVVSTEPLNILEPSGEKQTVLTPAECPQKVRLISPVRESHIFTRLSQAPVENVQRGNTPTRTRTRTRHLKETSAQSKRGKTTA